MRLPTKWMSDITKDDIDFIKNNIDTFSCENFTCNIGKFGQLDKKPKQKELATYYGCCPDIYPAGVECKKPGVNICNYCGDDEKCKKNCQVSEDNKYKLCELTNNKKRQSSTTTTPYTWKQTVNKTGLSSQEISKKVNKNIELISSLDSTTRSAQDTWRKTAYNCIQDNDIECINKLKTMPYKSYMIKGEIQKILTNSWECDQHWGQDYCPDNKVCSNNKCVDECEKGQHSIIYEDTTLCETCHTDKPLFNPTTNNCEVCPTDKPHFISYTNKCEACPTDKPRFNPTHNRCEACPTDISLLNPIKKPLFNPTTNKCEKKDNNIKYWIGLFILLIMILLGIVLLKSTKKNIPMNINGNFTE